MSDIKFDIYESPANDGEKKKYHVRNTNKQTIHSKDLIHEATLYTSVSRSNSEPATSTGFPECMRLYGSNWKRAK